jgi:hypothetical protein
LCSLWFGLEIGLGFWSPLSFVTASCFYQI